MGGGDKAEYGDGFVLRDLGGKTFGESGFGGIDAARDDGEAINRGGRWGTDAGFDVPSVGEEEGAVVFLPRFEEGELVTCLLEREIFDAGG